MLPRAIRWWLAISSLRLKAQQRRAARARVRQVLQTSQRVALLQGARPASTPRTCNLFAYIFFLFHILNYLFTISHTVHQHNLYTQTIISNTLESNLSAQAILGNTLGTRCKVRQRQRHQNGTKRLPHGRIPWSSRIGYNRVFWFRDCAREFTRLSASNSVMMSFMNACLGERCVPCQKTEKAAAT
jgi:hypothetical protein